jgi:hypothetical protein
MNNEQATSGKKNQGTSDKKIKNQGTSINKGNKENNGNRFWIPGFALFDKGRSVSLGPIDRKLHRKLCFLLACAQDKFSIDV